MNNSIQEILESFDRGSGGGDVSDLAKVTKLLKQYNAFKYYDAEIDVKTQYNVTYIIVDLGRDGVEDEELYDMLMSMKLSPDVYVRVVNSP